MDPADVKPIMVVCGNVSHHSLKEYTVMTVGSVRSLRLAAATLAVAGVALVGTATAAGATMGCGEYSFGFEGTRLLNDGISDSAGPFAIELPAGTYDVLMQSHDAHDEHPGQTEQTQEQWYFTLDSGYVSPVTSDVADESNIAVDEFDDQDIAESASITLHHLGQGGVNSVDPICVGFTTITSAVEEPSDDEVVVGGPLLPPKQPVVVEVPVIEAPAPVEAPVTAEVKTVVEVAEAPAVATSQLALTGPSAATTAMVLTGLGFMALGGILVLEEHRRSRMTQLCD